MAKRKATPQSPSQATASKSATECHLLSLSPTHCCTIVESINEGVFTIDAEKQITYFNPAAERITGFRPAEAVGRKCFDIFRTDICARACPLETALHTGKPGLNLRASMIGKCGNLVTVRLNVAPLKDENGRILGAVETFQDLSELEELRRQVSQHYAPEDIVGRNPRMREILAFLPDIAVSDSAVLIEGPTGAGKELIARAIHSMSHRRSGPFVAVNCAALPDSLLESELFGYAKGAFTGAIRNKAGRILTAHQGTLFLDEIGSTSMAFQTDLLRVLEDGVFTPLGANRPQRSDFRLVTATNLELKTLLQQNRFRDDLYYRLNVVKISLPPLRERKEDIPVLIDHFLRKFNVIKCRSISGVSPGVLSVLLDYPFPGNIRELENIIEYAFVACRGTLIDREHLPKDILEEAANEGRAPRPESHPEAEKIRAVLARCNGNRLEASRLLGMSRTTLWRKIRKYRMG
jgi:PAS domain S-box-containing protein